MLANYQMYRIASLEVDDEIQVDIDWKLLSDPMWNMWSSHYLQHKWIFLKGASNANDIVHHRGEYEMFHSAHVLRFILLIDVVHHLVRWISEKHVLVIR